LLVFGEHLRHSYAWAWVGEKVTESVQEPAGATALRQWSVATGMVYPEDELCTLLTERDFVPQFWTVRLCVEDVPTARV